MNKKLIALVLATVIVFTAAGIGTMAWFTSQATSQTNSFQAGTLSLGDGDSHTFATITLGNMQPGATVYQGTTALLNSGSLPLKLYRINATNIQDEAGLDQVLDVVVKIGNTTVYTGKLSQLVETNGGHFNPIIDVAPNTSLNLQLEVTMNAGAGNQYQEQQLKCDFIVYASQVEMPLPGQTEGWQQLATSNNQLFGVKGRNTATHTQFDFDWAANTGESATHEEYEVFLKHQKGTPDSIIEVTRRLKIFIIIPYNEVVIKEVTENGEEIINYATFNVDSKMISISKSAFDPSWELVDVKFTGMRRQELLGFQTWKYEGESNYVGWHLNR